MSKLTIIEAEALQAKQLLSWFFSPHTYIFNLWSCSAEISVFDAAPSQSFLHYKMGVFEWFVASWTQIGSLFNNIKAVKVTKWRDKGYCVYTWCTAHLPLNVQALKFFMNSNVQGFCCVWHMNTDTKEKSPQVQ